MPYSCDKGELKIISATMLWQVRFLINCLPRIGGNPEFGKCFATNDGKHKVRREHRDGALSKTQSEIYLNAKIAEGAKNTQRLSYHT